SRARRASRRQWPRWWRCWSRGPPGLPRVLPEQRLSRPAAEPPRTVRSTTLPDSCRAHFPISQTITNVIAPTVSLLPAGQQLQNTFGAPPIELAAPAILLAEADGGEAANQIVGAAVATTAAAEVASGGDGPGCGTEEPEVDYSRPKGFRAGVRDKV